MIVEEVIYQLRSTEKRGNKKNPKGNFLFSLLKIVAEITLIVLSKAKTINIITNYDMEI